jgi:hypothetical protein
MPKENKFVIYVGKKVSRYFETKSEFKEQLIYDGDLDEVNNLVLKSIHDAHTVAKLAGFEIYEIRDMSNIKGTWFSGDGKEVFASPEIPAWEEKEKQEKQEYDQTQRANVLRINAMPKKLLIREYRTKKGTIKLRTVRDTAGYDPKQSNKIKCYITCELEDEKGKTESIYMRSYISENRRLLRQKWKTNYEIVRYDCPDLANDLEFIWTRHNENKKKMLGDANAD